MNQELAPRLRVGAEAARCRTAGWQLPAGSPGLRGHPESAQRKHDLDPAEPDRCGRQVRDLQAHLQLAAGLHRALRARLAQREAARRERRGRRGSAGQRGRRGRRGMFSGVPGTGGVANAQAGQQRHCPDDESGRRPPPRRGTCLRRPPSSRTSSPAPDPSPSGTVIHRTFSIRRSPLRLRGESYPAGFPGALASSGTGPLARAALGLSRARSCHAVQTWPEHPVAAW